MNKKGIMCTLLLALTIMGCNEQVANKTEDVESESKEESNVQKIDVTRAVGDIQGYDYSDINSIFDEFVAVMKTKDNVKLRDFANKIAPPPDILEFMRAYKINYRKIPSELDNQKLEYTALGEMFYDRLLPVRNRMNAEGLLEDLKHTPHPDFPYTSELNNIKGVDLLFSDTDVYMKSGNKNVYYQLGEWLQIENRWCLFTKPVMTYKVN